MENRKRWSQFFTPVWAAEILFEAHFSHLTSDDLVWEPSCGPGNCLSVVPAYIRAIGSEIDPELVRQAQENTGRAVYHGDFRTVEFSELSQVTAIFGNPPFHVQEFYEFMVRCENILKLGQKAGFILPAYFFQSSSTVVKFSRKWSMQQEIIPRNLFHRLSKPLVFASFIRDEFPQLIGFRLHGEMCDITRLKDDLREIVNTHAKGSVWRKAVLTVMKDIGGTATLDQIYEGMEKKRPTSNPFWQAKIRQIVQSAPFVRVDTGKYTLTQNSTQHGTQIHSNRQR